LTELEEETFSFDLILLFSGSFVATFDLVVIFFGSFETFPKISKLISPFIF
jgi:hypothetical protein